MKLIVTADWHLRHTPPRCLKPCDWIGVQKKALGQIAKYAEEFGANVACVGDIFHNVNDTDFELVSMVQDFALKLDKHDLSLYILAGNHDLPFHAIDNLPKSAVNTLYNSYNIYPLKQLNKNVSAADFGGDVEDKKYVFRHILTFPSDKDMPPGCDGKSAFDLMAETPSARWIFVGDYHRHFVVYGHDCVVVNPGCLTIQAADFADYNPVVYYVDTKTSDVQELAIKVESEMQDLTDIADVTDYDEFINKVRDQNELTVDFVSNVKKALRKAPDELKSTIIQLFDSVGVNL